MSANQRNRIYASLPEQEREWLRTVARQQGTTVSALVCRIVRRHMRRAMRQRAEESRGQVVATIQGGAPPALNTPTAPLLMEVPEPVVEMLDKLASTGLWGKNRSEVALGLMNSAMRAVVVRGEL